MAGSEGRHPWDDFNALRAELEQYQTGLRHASFEKKKKNKEKKKKEKQLPFFKLSRFVHFHFSFFFPLFLFSSTLLPTTQTHTSKHHTLTHTHTIKCWLTPPFLFPPSTRNSIIVANKMDLPRFRPNLVKFGSLFPALEMPIFPICAQRVRAILPFFLFFRFPFCLGFFCSSLTPRLPTAPEPGTGHEALAAAGGVRVRVRR